MDQLFAFFGDHLQVVLALIALAIVLTVVVFRRQLFDRGYRKGEAARPDKVKRENPPDEWRRSH